jgi:iron complex transport system ATP-binding protein
MLRIADLVFNYNGSSILQGVAAEVPKGNLTAVAGPNGTGKTTLLKCIARVLRPCRGAVMVEERNTNDISRRELSRRIGYVPQNTPLRFPMTVFETILTGRRPHMAWRPAESDLQRTAEVIREMNLDHLAMREMNRLSGGQAQKVMIARALAQEPDYLLLDEPTSSLDLHHQLEVLELVAALVAQKGVGVLMAMHDLNLAARFAHTIFMMQGGRIVCRGTPLEVITPQNIRRIYGVEAAVRRDNGYPHIQPLRCVAADPGTDGLAQDQPTCEVSR